VEAEADRPLDERWVRCRRPMVMVGGELTLADLDLSYSEQVKYYEAPFQLKANCGMLLIDDFGRQKVAPRDLLNRWIVPLESEYDFLTMHTGKKLKVPFDVFVVFSTNLDPSELVDDACFRTFSKRSVPGAASPSTLSCWITWWKSTTGPRNGHSMHVNPVKSSPRCWICAPTGGKSPE
jgi:hypothetical protein